MASKKLTKSNDKVFSGVLGGVADYFNFDATLVRIIFAALVVFTGFSQWVFCTSLRPLLCPMPQLTTNTSLRMTVARTSPQTVSTTIFNRLNEKHRIARCFLIGNMDDRQYSPRISQVLQQEWVVSGAFKNRQHAAWPALFRKAHTDLEGLGGIICPLNGVRAIRLPSFF